MKRAYQNLVNALEELEEAEVQGEATRLAFQEASSLGPTGQLVGQEAIEAHHLGERKAWRSLQRANATSRAARESVLEVIRSTFPEVAKAKP